MSKKILLCCSLIIATLCFAGCDDTEEETTSLVATTSKQEVTTTAAETTTKQEETTTEVQTTTKQEETTTVVQTTTKQEETTTEPQTTTKQEVTTTEPQTTTKLEVTTTEPQTTTKPEETTTEPQTTTIAFTERQQQAIDKMNELYRDSMPPIYKDGYIDWVVQQGFTIEEASFAADNCGLNWDWISYTTASFNPMGDNFSKEQIISKLENKGYSHEDAVRIVDTYYK